jgi:tRNA C32,U32 (ribose-2'-O)-methylase TrmJ
MKKGCFIKLVFIITILVASVLYIVKNKFDDIFLNPGKELITKLIEDNWETELGYITGSAEKDSLKSLLHFYVEGIKTVDAISEDKHENLFELLQNTFTDSLITKEELLELTKIVKSLRNETTKEN